MVGEARVGDAGSCALREWPTRPADIWWQRQTPTDRARRLCERIEFDYDNRAAGGSTREFPSVAVTRRAVPSDAAAFMRKRGGRGGIRNGRWIGSYPTSDAARLGRAAAIECNLARDGGARHARRMVADEGDLLFSRADGKMGIDAGTVGPRK